MVIEVIQPNFTPGKDFGSLRQLRHLIEIGAASEFGFVRMNSDRRINEFMFFGELDGAVKGAWSGSAADGENSFNPRIFSPLEHSGAVRIELLHFEMSVGVDENWSLVVGHRWFAAR